MACLASRFVVLAAGLVVARSEACTGDSCAIADEASLLQVSVRPSHLLSPAASLSAAPSAQQRLQLLKPLFWLHIPKTGTSMSNMWVYNTEICPLLPSSYSEELGFAIWGDVWDSYCPGALSPFMNAPHQSIGTIYNQIAGHIVAMFRQPEQRIMSDYWDHVVSDISMLEYAKASQGCMVRMITKTSDRKICSEFPEATEEDLPVALSRLEEGFAFVGLTEKWDLSVCLFHAKFGAPCKAIEFLNAHPTDTDAKNTSDSSYDTTELHGWVDKWDGKVYQEAESIFAKDLDRLQVTEASCAEWCFL